MPHSKTASSVYKLQVMDRALAILDVLGSVQGDSSLSELCVALNLHKSTLHRLMMVLERHRLVDKNPDTGRYRLGLKLFELGSKAIASLDLGEVLYIAKIEPQRNLRIAAHVGHRFPAYCTALGKAMLAELPDPEVDAILRGCDMKVRTPNTITSPAMLKDELRMIRSRGYSIDDEENDEGARCVGVAVRDQRGRPVAAISVSGPASRVTKSKVPDIAKVVIRSAEALSRELGYSSENLASVGIGTA
jgi:IclR family KDG regulon transcriptional repressor